MQIICSPVTICHFVVMTALPSVSRFSRFQHTFPFLRRSNFSQSKCCSACITFNCNTIFSVSLASLNNWNYSSRCPGGIIATSAGYFQCARVAALVWSTLKTELFTLFLMKDPDTLQSHSFTSGHGLDLSVTALCSHPVWITTDLFNVEHCRNPLAAREVNATDYLNSFL